MLKPPRAVGVEARKKSYNSIIPRSSATSKYLVNESLHLSPPLQQQERSACSSASPEPEPQEPALRIELVPANARVGINNSYERFWLIHQASELRIPGQFSYCEAEEILKVTHAWNWTVDPRTREPGCRYQLLNLLERICKPQKVFEVAA